MIKDSVFFEHWKRAFMRSEDLDLERRSQRYQGMFDEVRVLRILLGRDPCAGLETKIRLMKAIHVQAASEARALALEATNLHYLLMADQEEQFPCE